MDTMMYREIQEAIYVGETALHSLEAARRQLSSARGWGVVDILGGGFLTNLMKHSRMQNAQALMQQAQSDLHAFERELKDIVNIPNLQIDISDFLSFADFFWDGLFADALVQSKIIQAQREVNASIASVTAILDRLRAAQ